MIRYSLFHQNTVYYKNLTHGSFKAVREGFSFHAVF